MAQNVVIRGITYPDTPAVEIPKSNETGNAIFYDTSDATLNNGNQMLSGVTSYGAEGKVSGTIASKSSSDLTVSGATVTVPAGNYANAASASVASGSVTAPATISGTSAAVSTGSNTLTLTKSVSVTPTVTTAGYVSSGTAANSSVTLTASVTTKAAATITPTTTDQTIASGTYLTGVQTIKGDANLVSSNIVKNKSIFGVSGAVDMPVISQDATTKILSIS